MATKLLFTLRLRDSYCTLSLDDSLQSVLWLSMNGGSDASEALAYVEATDQGVLLHPTGDSRVSGQTKHGPGIALESTQESIVAIENPHYSEPIVLFSRPVSEGICTYRKLLFTENVSVDIGRNRTCGLRYKSPFVSGHHAFLVVEYGRFTITDLKSVNGTIVNGRSLVPGEPCSLVPGDVVQILDLTFMVGNSFLCINQPDGFSVGTLRGTSYLSHTDLVKANPVSEHGNGEIPLFYPAPRLSRSVHPLVLQVDDPPSKKFEDDQPLLLFLGPSFLMGLASVFMASVSISKIRGGSPWQAEITTIAMAVAMVCGSIVWPILSRAYNRKRDKRDEDLRTSLYESYLEGVECKLLAEAEEQTQILLESRRTIQEIAADAKTLSPMLMNRAVVHKDFLDLRVGVGDSPVAIDAHWPDRHFTLEDDPLLDRVAEFSKNPPMLRDVPLAFNPAEHYVSGILGNRDEVWSFLRGLLIQVCSLYSYQDVKIMVVGDRSEAPEWVFLESLGHFYDDFWNDRLVAISYQGMVTQDLRIESELERRAEQNAEVLADYGAYYIIVCANKELAERSEGIRRLLHLRSNVGFSLIYLGQGLSDLPRECNYLVDLSHDGGKSLGISLEMANVVRMERKRQARMFVRDDVAGALRQFDPDVVLSKAEARSIALDLGRIRLDTPAQMATMPETLGFLEMFQVGDVTRLNVAQRGAENDASQSLQTPIGVGSQSELAFLDLHEKIHGPHGLIAGTTGSGKSEFIITYVLSLSTNYSPDEVAFVLIDYKGGGLAGAFDNERYRLPHLAGTITNLDGAAIHRSLVSINSELKRRQDVFNHARDITGESTIDIYKYISFYRQGVLKEPLPHLFIVADEFAELKQQEPEFMDELISAARIGRSLGVHLILATQKPMGVVNDQIWSNSRFKVCLKVSDASDSKEMIQRDDAAEITQAGRYYLLVGYNESFTSGQAAYAGAEYAPTEIFEQKRDNAVELLNLEGNAIARLRPMLPIKARKQSEMNAVLAQIMSVADATGKRAGSLWLEPLSEHIKLSDVVHRYGSVSDRGLNCIIGELDDPDNQVQMRYEVDMAQTGNVILYGSQGSDVEGLLQTMIFSMCDTKSASELWFYAIDLGLGGLSELSGLPHCGGVVLPGDEERMGTLFRMVAQEISSRRALLSSYGGSLEAYNRHSESRLPYMVVALTNLASFAELYTDLEEQLISLTRDCVHYGIFFMVTTPTVGSARLRLRSNFSLEIPTLLNDDTEYLSVLGTLRGVSIPQTPRRGLARINERFLEFQGAELGTHEEASKIIGELSVRLQDGPSAKRIPQLPTYVHVADMNGFGVTPNQIPVGFSKAAIAPIAFDTSRDPYMMVMGDEMEAIGMYLRGLYEALRESDGVTYRVVDFNNVLNETFDNNVIADEVGFSNLMDELESDLAPHVLVLTSVGQIVTMLPTLLSQRLQDYIAKEQGMGKTILVAASEFWRVRSVYQDWYKVLSAHGSGVWCGGGFSEQTVFRFARLQPEYREVASRSDGFLCVHGKVTSIRLLESNSEPRSDDEEWS